MSGTAYKLITLASDTDPEIVVTTLLHHGCVAIKDALDPATLDRLKADLEPHLAATGKREGSAIPPELRYSGRDMDDVITHAEDALGQGTRRCSSLFARSPEMSMLATHPLLTAICDRVLLKSCSNYQIGATQAIQIFPDSPAQPLHRDDFIYPMSHQGTELMVSSLWALDDFTETNGATRIIPGSQLWTSAEAREACDDQAVSAVVPKGSAIIYLGSTVHGGGHNRSNAPRLALYVGMILGWLRQEENQYVAIPHDVIRNLSPRMQQLMGYTMHAPLMGWVELKDPVEAI